MNGILRKPAVRNAIRREVISMFQDGTIRASGDGLRIDFDGHSITISISQESEQIVQQETAPAPVTIEAFDSRFS